MPRLRPRPVTARTIAALSSSPDRLAHEALVDLDLVEREFAQIAQRRIAGAEIVHRDGHAEFAQAHQHRERASVSCSITVSVISSSSRCRVEPRCAERRNDIEDKRVALELNRRQIDGDLDVARPCRRLGARLLEHPGADRNDQPDLFRQRNEIVRRHQSALGMPPAQQRFERRRFPGRDRLTSG